MKHRFLTVLTALLLLCIFSALAEDAAFTNAPDLMRPGKTERISFSVPEDGSAQLDLIDENGSQAVLIRESMTTYQGENHLSWNGEKADKLPVQPGTYTLRLVLTGSTNTYQALHTLTVGEPAPQVTHIQAPGVLVAGDTWNMMVDCSVPGTLEVRIRLADGEWYTLHEASVQSGTATLSWDGKLDNVWVPSGDYSVQARLTDESGFTGTPQQISLILSDMPTPTPVPTATPRPTPYLPSQHTTQEEENNYWTLPIGEWNEEKIWEIMMQPITVLEGEQKETFKIRSTPNDDSRENIIGEITCASQGVHVLSESENGWTLVEAYNSSYGPDCTSRPGYGATDERLTGYVKTSLLKEITPRTDYALLIDKLKQEMYIFSEGKCVSTLLISTGEPTSKQPWNETPAGEFLMVSRVGGFPAGNLWCAYGMRINGGCLIHEVPYIGDKDTPGENKDYSSTVPKLGSKASHGCIRVQKAKNEAGHNITWLWNNIKVNTKVLIWDDTGRRVAYPDDSTPIYYNQDGGKYFHENQYCSSVRERFLPLTESTYGELESLFEKPQRCSKCATLKTKAEIDAINEANGIH